MFLIVEFGFFLLSDFLCSYTISSCNDSVSTDYNTPLKYTSYLQEKTCSWSLFQLHASRFGAVKIPYLQENLRSWSHCCLHASRFRADKILLLLPLIHPPLFSTQLNPGAGVVRSDPGDDGTGKERQFNA